jgi:hypothetical protein
MWDNELAPRDHTAARVLFIVRRTYEYLGTRVADNVCTLWTAGSGRHGDSFPASDQATNQRRHKLSGGHRLKGDNTLGREQPCGKTGSVEKIRGRKGLISDPHDNASTRAVEQRTKEHVQMSRWLPRAQQSAPFFGDLERIV